MLQWRESLGKRFRWVPQRGLAEIIFLCVREVLDPSPAHPDSKRQDRRKRRDLERYGARILKQSSISCSPAKKTSKRREIKAMRLRLQEERKEQAAIIAGRLLGKIEQGEALFFLPGKWENVNGKWSKTDGN